MVLATTILFAVLLASISFTTEPEELGRRVRKQVPKHPLLAFLAAPFLPGGGRGLLLFISLLVLLNSALGATFLMTPPARVLWSSAVTTPSEPALRGVLSIAVLSLYAFLYVALPTGLFSFVRAFPRVLIRILIPLFATLAFVIPTIWSLFLREEGNSPIGIDHLGNPFWIPDDIINNGSGAVTKELIIIGMLGLLALALNLTRIVRGLTEVLQRSAERRAGAAPAFPETDPPSSPPSIDAVPER